MKVKDLLKALVKENPEATVILQSSNVMEHGQANVEMTAIIASGTGKVTHTKHRDGFDNSMYEGDVWTVYSDGDKLVVQLV